MIVGIVGAEASKFTYEAEMAAKAKILQILTAPGVKGVSSGHCHLGGIDIWAEEIGQRLGIGMYIYPPLHFRWDDGYKDRNILIARVSTEVHCITVRELPPGFKGMRFESCYHCHSTDHVKSGGCWTAKYAERLGKPAHWHTISNGASTVNGLDESRSV
jgi:hypothetical protein